MEWTDIRKAFAASIGLKRRDDFGGVGMRAILLKRIFGK
jgi:hypothetical protein